MSEFPRIAWSACKSWIAQNDDEQTACEQLEKGLSHVRVTHAEQEEGRWKIISQKNVSTATTSSCENHSSMICISSLEIAERRIDCHDFYARTIRTWSVYHHHSTGDRRKLRRLPVREAFEYDLYIITIALGELSIGDHYETVDVSINARILFRKTSRISILNYYRVSNSRNVWLCLLKHTQLNHIISAFTKYSPHNEVYHQPRNWTRSISV